MRHERTDFGAIPDPIGRNPSFSSNKRRLSVSYKERVGPVEAARWAGISDVKAIYYLKF
jgi:hypothetical protein